MSHYTFGDNELARSRLEHLAQAYEASSAEFLRTGMPSRVARAVDLGSGLGLTTALLAQVSRASFVAGYERSANYLSYARAQYPQLTFREVDVLCPPYPDSELDVIYARFLLTHLDEPQKVMKSCVEHLRPGGRLLVEEVKELSSTIPVLQKYYGLVAEMQAHYGQELTVGARLSEMAEGLPCCRVTVKEVRPDLATATMVRLHAMNIGTWKNDPFMRSRHGVAGLEQLEAELEELLRAGDSQPSVVCVMAQAIVER